jgi:hypothetical protein
MQLYFSASHLSYLELPFKKCHTLGELNNRKLFPHSSGSTSPRSRFWLIQFLVRAIFLVCRWLTSHCVFAYPFLGYGKEESEGEGGKLFSSLGRRRGS